MLHSLGFRINPRLNFDQNIFLVFLDSHILAIETANQRKSPMHSRNRANSKYKYKPYPYPTDNTKPKSSYSAMGPSKNFPHFREDLVTSSQQTFPQDLFFKVQPTNDADDEANHTNFSKELEAQRPVERYASDFKIGREELLGQHVHWPHYSGTKTPEHIFFHAMWRDDVRCCPSSALFGTVPERVSLSAMQ